MLAGSALSAKSLTRSADMGVAVEEILAAAEWDTRFILRERLESSEAYLGISVSEASKPSAGR